MFCNLTIKIQWKTKSKFLSFEHRAAFCVFSFLNESFEFFFGVNFERDYISSNSAIYVLVMKTETGEDAPTLWNFQ